MTIDMSQFFQVFFDEAEELLAEMEKLLLGVDISSPDPEDLNAIFRAAHSIKGGASTFGLADMTEVTHILENLLDKIRKGEMHLTSDHVDAFLSAKDILKMQLDGHRLGTVVDLDAVGDVRMLLQSFVLDDLTPKALPAPNFAHISLAPDTHEKYQHCFRVTFLDVKAADLDLLTSELGLLGVARCEKSTQGQDCIVLKTNGSEDDIFAVCSFIVDAD